MDNLSVPDLKQHAVCYQNVVLEIYLKKYVNNGTLCLLLFLYFPGRPYNVFE